MSNLLSGFEWEIFSFKEAFDTFKSIAVILAIVMAIGYIVLALTLKGDTRKKFFKYGTIAVAVIASIIGLVLLIWSLKKDGIEKILFIPLLILLLTIAINGILFTFMKNKALIIESIVTITAAFLATIICVIILSIKQADENVKSVPLYLTSFVLIAVVLVLTVVFGRHEKNGFDTKSIAYGAISLAIAFVLSYLKLFSMPTGGSVTIAQVLPIMIYSYMFGVKKGVFVAFIFGLLQALQGAYVVHPAQFLLDYPVAYMCFGLAGLLRNCKAFDKMPQLALAIGGIISGVGRYISHFLSGVFAFNEGKQIIAAITGSLTYNVYVFVDIAIAIVVGVIMFSSKSFMTTVKRVMKTQEEVVSFPENEGNNTAINSDTDTTSDND